MAAGPYSIGSDLWPGLSKLAEEAGEVLQVIGKLIATGGDVHHWDGTNLRTRIGEEMGDLLAAINFVARENGLDAEVYERYVEKKALFQKWHGQQANPEDVRRTQPGPPRRPSCFCCWNDPHVELDSRHRLCPADCGCLCHASAG